MVMETVRRVVILKAAEAEALAEELQATPSSDEQPEAAGETASPKGFWQVYYDTEAFNLTLRGWWLREENGVWILDIPVPQGGYETLTDSEEILRRVGLETAAEALRSGKAKRIDNLLAQVGVQPFARLKAAQCRRGTVKGSESDAAGSAPLLEVSLDVLEFDLRYAENQAISDHLFYSPTREAMAVTEAGVADIRPCLAAAGSATSAGVEASWERLFTALRARGLERFEPPCGGPCPRLLAYLWALRPAHLRALSRSGAVPPWTWPGQRTVMRQPE
eukprot:TRINITY_DN19770_c0_g1_i2.p1 TRINITY_DN19770_c0_g1~~TRINITY_DN19770_c0_g1_i2.p1  ORF type:complete len:277 (+),score=54.05 TRINITY_DN19770_c0_g1_i2:88-918(+)